MEFLAYTHPPCELSEWSITARVRPSVRPSLRAFVIDAAARRTSQVSRWIEARLRCDRLLGESPETPQLRGETSSRGSRGGVVRSGDVRWVRKDEDEKDWNREQTGSDGHDCAPGKEEGRKSAPPVCRTWI